MQQQTTEFATDGKARTPGSGMSRPLLAQATMEQLAAATVFDIHGNAYPKPRVAFCCATGHALDHVELGAFFVWLREQLTAFADELGVSPGAARNCPLAFEAYLVATHVPGGQQ